MILSKFAHVFEKDDIYCYLNSLTSQLVYLSSQENKILKKIISTQDINEDNKELIYNLVQNNILIESSKKDDDLLESVYKGLLPAQITIGYFILTESCNLACKYCFLDRTDTDINNLKAIDLKTAEKCLRFFINQSNLSDVAFSEPRNIIFYGGEPLLNFKALKSVVNTYKKLREIGECPFTIIFSIVTNGTLITKEIADFFTENRINVSISVDGPTLEANLNRIFKKTQSPAFNRILKSISILNKNKCFFGLSLTLSDEALKVPINQLIEFLEQNNINNLSFNTLICRDKIRAQSYYERAANYIIDFWKVARERNIVEDRISRKIKAFASNIFEYSDCAAVAGCQLCFYPNGDVNVCHGCKKTYSERHWDIYTNENLNKSPTLNKWIKLSPIFNDKCIGCSAIGICGGGCVINKKANKADPSIDLGFCIHTKKIQEFLIWDLYQIMMNES